MHRQGRAVRVREGVPAAVSVSIASRLRGAGTGGGRPKAQKPATQARAAKIKFLPPPLAGMARRRNPPAFFPTPVTPSRWAIPR